MAIVSKDHFPINEGEWETWCFAHWLSGAVRYRSFADWIPAERHTCRRPDGADTAPLQNRLRLLRTGEVGANLVTLT